MMVTTETFRGARCWYLPERDAPQAQGNAWPTLAQLQGWVQGYVEHVGLTLDGEPVHLFVNEDGHRERFAVNALASELYYRAATDPTRPPPDRPLTRMDC